MTLNELNKTCHQLKGVAISAYLGWILLTPFGQPNAAAQALLYDNTDHLWTGTNSGPRNMIWVGAEEINWIDAQPFKLGGHDNVASVSIPMARGLNASAMGTISFSIWDDNGRGFPGEEVGELGVIDVESLPRYDFPGRLFPNPLPSVTFDSPIDDLIPGDTYYVVIDYGDLNRIKFGDVLVGLGNDFAGTNVAGIGLYTSGARAAPPLEDGDWEPGSFGSHHYIQMSVTAEGEPFTSIVCPVGTTYFTTFDGLGADGMENLPLPQGWAFFDATSENGTIYNNFITADFPAPKSLPKGTGLFNAGHPDDSDRALTVGTPRSAGEATLQLVAEVSGGDATSIQLGFDIEAWDNASSRNKPGEAAFNVALDLDTGDGFQEIMDLGQVTTGATLVPLSSPDEYVDGNDDAYRTSFDSGLLNLDLPEGSQLRVRWMADLEAKTRGWIYGLDNVSLGMFADNATILGDFDDDGRLTAADIDLLSAEIRTPTGDLSFDVNSDGVVDTVDHQHWVTAGAYGNTLLGDANLDGNVDFPDFLAVSNSFGREGGWAQGDFDGNGVIEFSDFLVVSANFGSEAAASAEAVPEPSGSLLAAFGILGLVGLRRRR